MNNIGHNQLDIFDDYQQLVKIFDNSIQRNIIMIYTILNRNIFTPVRFSARNIKNFFILMEKINTEEPIKEDYIFDMDFAEDLIKFGLLQNIQSKEKFQFKALQEKMPLVKGMKIFKNAESFRVGLTAEAIERILRYNLKKMEDLDIKKAIAMMRAVPCSISKIQHDLFDLHEGYLLLLEDVMDVFQENIDCYLYFSIEKMKNDIAKSFNDMKLSLVGLIKVFGREFAQDSVLKRFSEYQLSEFTDYIRSMYLKNDMLVIKSRFQNPIRLSDQNPIITEWIEKLNKLIYCYLDIDRFSPIFNLLIESTAKSKFIAPDTLKIQNIFENIESFLSYIEESNTNDRIKSNYSDQIQLFRMNNIRTIASYYENCFKLIKIAMNILDYLKTKHNIDELLNKKEDFILFNKKVY